MESELLIDAKLEDNLVHKEEALIVTPKKEDKSFITTVLESIGFIDLYNFPAQVEEAANWKEGDEITIKVVNRRLKS